LGHDVTVVGNSSDAFAAFERATAEGHPFGAIFVDLTMPGDLSGKDVIDHLRARDMTTKIIVMSGYSTDPIMANYEAYGLTARLQKPFTLANVRELLT
jgi:CheY-like chemotaxis protein